MNLPIVSPNANDLPLPLYVAQEWKFPLAYVDQDGNPSHYLYSVQDWIEGIGETDRARKQWNDIKKQLSESHGHILLQKLPYKTKNGRIYQMDYTDAEGLYRIAQELRPTKDRIRLDAIRQYLASAGVLVDEVRRDADAAAALLDDLEARHREIRARGKQKRIKLTETARDTHEKGRPDYAGMTNAEYEELFGAAKDELVKTLGLTPTQAARFRDHISTLALQAIDAAETTGAIKMQQLGRRLSTPEQIQIVRHAARLIAPGFWALADYLNIDLLSGNPLLPQQSV